MKRILVIHGPNLDLLGEREPHIYGSQTLEALNVALRDEARVLGVGLEAFQSNHEGEILDRLRQARQDADGVILNPAGLSHTSVCLRDAVAAAPFPVVEVHLSNPSAREEFRRIDLIAPVCRGIVAGLGLQSYLAALRALAALLGD
jgi:3-dehydroquinate dehydratase-2